jgi:DNA polymerase III epsilon subunit-like protein
MTVPSSLLSLNGNMMVSVDVETTGLTPGYHEIVQIAVVPLDNDIMPSKEHRAFYIHICPEFPERADPKATKIHGLDMDWLITNGIDKWRAADMLEEWVTSLDLPVSKRVAPLAHNFPFEKAFLSDWLGRETYDALFYIHHRDTQVVGSLCNDLASYWGKDIPFGRVGLSSMCEKMGVVNDKAHDSLADALAGANLYRELVKLLGS